MEELRVKNQYCRSGIDIIIEEFNCGTHQMCIRDSFCRDTNLAAGKQPACVEACPTKALTFGDMNDPSSAVSHKVKENPVYRTKVELGTQPNLYHIPFQHGEPRR